jgi:hypothetical protein
MYRVVQFLKTPNNFTENTSYRCAILIQSYIFLIVYFERFGFHLNLFLYYMYSMLLFSFFCYPFGYYFEYVISVVLFFLGVVPLGCFYVCLENSDFNFASSFISSTVEFRPELYVVFSVNVCLFFLTIPAFRFLIRF